MRTQDNGTKVPYRAPFFRGSTTHSKVKEWIGLMMRRKAIQCKPADQQYLRLVKGAVSFLSWIQRQLCIFALRRSFRRVKIAIARQLGASGSHASRFHTGCAVSFNAPPSKEGSSAVGDIRLIWIRMPAAERVSMVESTVHILSHYCVPNSRDRKSTRVIMPNVACTT